MFDTFKFSKILYKTISNAVGKVIFKQMFRKPLDTP